MDEADFIIDGETATSKADKPKQLNHVAEIALTDDMPEGQKAFARAFNEMRDTLIQNKLMKLK